MQSSTLNIGSKNPVWFAHFIEKINTKTKVKKRTKRPNLQDNLFLSSDDTLTFGNEVLKQSLITKMTIDYLNELNKRNLNFELYLDFNNSGLLAWFIIDDDDYETEKQIHLAAAKVNVNYYKYGYNITNSIVEKSDNIKVPEHYKKIK